ncbi:MAG: hypothetical protein K0V04_03090 [Deltaproteobacteria bacterium]|nr:hypothetical protein [Deltaproteobacteria bacterium]
MCEQWALSAQTGCAYPGGLVYLEEVCEGYVANASAQCQLEILALLTCEANQGGPCDPSCQSESDDSEACEDAVQAKALGCAMIPMVAATGTIPAQCEAVTAQAFACDAEGYYISFFSPYVNYPPGTAQPYCEAAFPWLLDTTPLSDISPECGGAYEELLTCLSGLDCVELDDAITNGLSCTSEIDALICRCALGA